MSRLPHHPYLSQRATEPANYKGSGEERRQAKVTGLQWAPRPGFLPAF